MQSRNIDQTTSKGNTIIGKAMSVISEYHKRPLRIALQRLRDKGDTYQVLADTVFEGTVTKQNVYQRFFKGEKSNG